MNTKFKVALLTLLGFSASACCGTKKAAKSEDKKEADIIINEDNDPRVHLMYGVPFPDGKIVRPVDENGNPLPPARNGAKSEGAKFPDGRVAIPIDEESKEAVETNAKEAVHDEEPDLLDMVLE
ncbi:MAG: hypothetical protein IKW47_02885 [Alistipes sp.]|nr:hypothetical protein [Alistipes sp.]